MIAETSLQVCRRVLVQDPPAQHQLPCKDVVAKPEVLLSMFQVNARDTRDALARMLQQISPQARTSLLQVRKQQGTPLRSLVCICAVAVWSWKAYSAHEQSYQRPRLFE